MELNITQELATLRRLPPRELLGRYAELFGERPRTKNKGWLLKRLAWRLQALAEGDLSQRARQRAAELANDADLRTTPPRPPRAGSSRPKAWLAPSRTLALSGAKTLSAIRSTARFSQNLESW